MAAVRLRARWVIPVVAPPIPQGAVLVDGDGRIGSVGPDAAVPRPDGAADLDLGEAALLPGLVNTHAHLELMALRGLVTEVPFPRWIARVKRLGDVLAPDHFRASARWGVLESFAHGITTIGDTGRTGMGARAMAELGARGVAYHETFGPDPAQLDQSLKVLQDALHELDALASDRLEIGVSPHAPYTVSDQLLAAVGSLAHIQNRKVAMHVAESVEERMFMAEGRGAFADHLRGRGIAVEPRGASSVRWALETGLEPLRPLLIHCVHVDGEDARAMAACGASAAHCPSSNQLLGNGHAPLGLLQDAGVTVGVGTDSVAAGNSLDLFHESRQAALGVPLAPNYQLRLITAGAADALGIEDAGRLVPGAWADLCAVALRGSTLSATKSIEGALAVAATAGHVIGTWVAGKLVYRDGSWPGVDAAEEKAAYNAACLAAKGQETRKLEGDR